MPSPFPGMDPYLEAAGEWPDFLPRFLTYACDTLAEHLPDRYDVKIDECVLLEGGPEGGSRLNLPDVAVLEGPDPRPRRAAAAASVATLEPVSIPRARSCWTSSSSGPSTS